MGGRQEVNLQSPGCLSKIGTPMHELMHAMGFMHEQNRWERDDYVSINWQHIQSGQCQNQYLKTSHFPIHHLREENENRFGADVLLRVNRCVISTGRNNNFDKADKSMTDGQGVNYDYRSVMHYSAKAFSRDGSDTISPRVRGQVPAG